MKNGNKTEYPKSKALCPAEKKRNSSSYTFQIIKRSLIIFILKKAIIVVHSFNPSTWETKAGLVSTVRFFLQQNKMSQVDNESLTRIIQRQTALLLCDMIFHTGVTSPNHSNNMQQQKLIFCCCCFKTGSHYVALVGPEFRYSLCRMALNLQSSACLYFLSARIKGIYHHAHPKSMLFGCCCFLKPFHYITLAGLEVARSARMVIFTESHQPLLSKRWD